MASTGAPTLVTGLLKLRRPRPTRADERGEALPAAILFLGVMITILIGIHVVLIAMARTAVQAAADAAVAAAQIAGEGNREREGELAAQIAMAAAQSSIIETRPPQVIVEPERGVVTVLVFGGTITPVLGGVELTAQACGPLDDVPALGSDLPAMPGDAEVEPRR